MTHISVFVCSVDYGNCHHRGVTVVVTIHLFASTATTGGSTESADPAVDEYDAYVYTYRRRARPP